MKIKKKKLEKKKINTKKIPYDCLEEICYREHLNNAVTKKEKKKQTRQKRKSAIKLSKK